MSFWRKDPPPPAAPWRARFDKASEMVRAHSTDASIQLRLDDVERSLTIATADEERLRTAIEALRPEEAAAELKEALRSRRDPTAPDTPLIRTLRERYESISDLQNRLESLRAQQESTLVDLDTLAAHLVEASLQDVARPFESEVDRLRADAEILRAAHAEIEHL